MEKRDKAGKPHAHLEAIPATAVWKFSVVIPSHIPKSSEICRQDKPALLCKNLSSTIKYSP